MTLRPASLYFRQLLEPDNEIARDIRNHEFLSNSF